VDVIELRRLHDVRDRIVEARRQPVVGPMAAPLDAAIVMKRELVVLLRLQCEADGGVADVLIVNRLLARRREGVAEEVVRTPAAERPEEPEAIAPDRTAERDVHVVHALHSILLPEAEINEVLRQVVRLHAVVGAGDEDRAVVVLPPSCGIMLICTPPTGASAGSELV